MSKLPPEPLGQSSLSPRSRPSQMSYGPNRPLERDPHLPTNDKRRSGCQAALWTLVVASLLFAACGLFVVNGGSSQSATTSPGSQPTATIAPQPTETLALSAPALGVTRDAFKARFGEPPYTVKRAWSWNVTLNGTAVFLSIGATSGASGAFDAVTDIEVISPVGSSIVWTPEQGEAIVKLFLPADAQYVEDRTLEAFSEQYLEHVYHSDSLAATFSAKEFDDQTTLLPVAPGSFYYACGGPAAARGGCVLALGR